MKIKISDIPDDGLKMEGKADLHFFELPKEGILEWKGIDYDLEVERLQDEILVRGKVEAHLDVTCSRCTDPMKWCISVPNFCESFKSRADDSIDLTSRVTEDILLNFPIAPSCELDEQQRCPLSGESYADDKDRFADRNRESVWGALDQLKVKENHGTT